MRFAKFRATKTYDLLTAVPLILWYGLGIWAQLPNLLGERITLGTDAQNIRALLHVLALATSFAFLGVLVVLLLLRPPPVTRPRGWMPRAAAFLHGFFGTAYLWIPAADTSLALTIVSWLLTLVGSMAAIFVVFWLGRGFSIIPEARILVMRGPYARIRHPLYLAEMVGALGVMLQFQQPWAGLLFAASIPLLVLRMHYEERVLGEAFPDYRDYAARTARIIPGVY